MDGSNENRTRIRLLARSPKASEALTLDDLVVLTTYDLGETRRTMYRAELVILFDRVDAARTVIDERWGHPARSGIPDDVREHRSKVSGIRTILREALCLRSLCVCSGLEAGARADARPTCRSASSGSASARSSAWPLLGRLHASDEEVERA